MTFIVKLGGRYLEWSTMTDAPASPPMTREELIAYVRRERGDREARVLMHRLARVDAKGTSCVEDASAEETVSYNRAGRGETQLTLEQIVEHFVRRGGVGPLPVGTRPQDVGERGDAA